MPGKLLHILLKKVLQGYPAAEESSQDKASGAEQAWDRAV